MIPFYGQINTDLSGTILDIVSFMIMIPLNGQICKNQLMGTPVRYNRRLLPCPRHLQPPAFLSINLHLYKNYRNNNKMAFLLKRPCCHPRPVQGVPSSGDDRLHLQQVRGEEDEQRQDVVWVAADVGDQQDWSLCLKLLQQGRGN